MDPLRDGCSDKFPDVSVPLALSIHIETWKLNERNNKLDSVSRTEVKFWKYSLQQNYPSTQFMKYICQIIIFRLYAVYNKHDIIKIYNETREKIQVLSQVL